MKYTISEPRILKVIMNYLDDELGGLEKHSENILDTTYQYWADGDRKVIEIGELTDEGEIRVGIDDGVWNSFRNTFKLSPTATYRYLKIWMKNNIGVDPHYIYHY